MLKFIDALLRLARLNEPIGTWLLLLPGWWSITLASSSWSNFRLYFLFFIGAVIMRSAGCIINDIADINFDGLVERTKKRPLVKREITTFQAIVFLSFLLLIGFAILIQFNFFSIVVGACSLILVFIYPFMKRITFWPQAILGLTFNWGALLGWSTVTGELSFTAVALYFAGFFWTLGYDTIYAHQDKTDDALIGVKSTALKFGHKTKPWLTIFYFLATCLFCICGIMEELSPIYYLGILAIGLHFSWQIFTLDIDCSNNCLARFKSNRECGFIMLLTLILVQIKF